MIRVHCNSNYSENNTDTYTYPFIFPYRFVRNPSCAAMAIFCLPNARLTAEGAGDFLDTVFDSVFFLNRFNFP